MKRNIYILLAIILITTSTTFIYLNYFNKSKESIEHTYRDRDEEWPDDSFMRTVTGNPEEIGEVYSSVDEFSYVDTGPTSPMSSEITFKGFSKVIKDLPPQKTIKEFTTELSKDGNKEMADYVSDMIDNILSEKENMDMDIFTRFLNVNEYVEEVDTLNDGTKLVYMCALGRNHPCYVGFYVIKDNKITFSINGEIQDVISTKDGYSVKWIPYDEKPYSDFPMCCKPGYRTTYFDFDFKPIGETETIFTKVIVK